MFLALIFFLIELSLPTCLPACLPSPWSQEKLKHAKECADRAKEAKAKAEEALKKWTEALEKAAAVRRPSIQQSPLFLSSP